MLVLGRKTDEKIMIGENIEIRVLHASRDYVKLGFTAPADVVIDREEIWLSKRGLKKADVEAAKRLDLEERRT